MSKGKLNTAIVGDIKDAFEVKCIHILIDGYNEVIRQNSYELSWEEERITAELIKFMKAAPRTQEWRIHVIPEPRIYSEDVYNNSITPKEAPRIDMQLLNWSSSEELVYHIEAKNLAEKDWNKTDGSQVNASYLTIRYIDTGIGNFTNDRYKNGCLTGYILNGTIPNVLARINKTMIDTKKRPLEIINSNTTINGHTFCYVSNHKKEKKGTAFRIYHILLKF